MLNLECISTTRTHASMPLRSDHLHTQRQYDQQMRAAREVFVVAKATKPAAQLHTPSESRAALRSDRHEESGRSRAAQRAGGSAGGRLSRTASTRSRQSWAGPARDGRGSWVRRQRPRRRSSPPPPSRGPATGSAAVRRSGDGERREVDHAHDAADEGAVRGRAAAPRQARRGGGLPTLPAAVEVRHLHAAHGGRRAPAAPATAAGSATKSPKPAARTTAPIAARGQQVIDVPHPGHPAQPQRSGRSRPRRFALMRATRDATERPRSRCGCWAAGVGRGWGVGTAARWRRSVAT